MAKPSDNSLFDQLLESDQPNESSKPAIAVAATTKTASRLWLSIFAGVFTGVISLVKTISFAALIFSAGLSPYLPAGLGMLFISNIMIRVVTACSSSFPPVVYNPQSEQVVVLTFMAAAIHERFFVSTPPEILLSTIVVCIAFSSLLAGLTLFLLGTLRQGDLGRYLPYPITGGFLAGISWLLIVGALQLIAGRSLRWALVPELWHAQILLQLLAGLLFALGLLYFTRHSQQTWIMPLGFVIAVALFYGLTAAVGYSMADAHKDGWFLDLSAQFNWWQPLNLTNLSVINWSIFRNQVGAIGTLIFLTTLSLLLGATNLELSLDKDVDPNRELKSLGMANIASGLLGGAPGTLSLSSSLLAYRLGGRTRLVGLSGAALYAVMLLMGTSWLGHLPKFALGGLLLFSGIDLLMRWFVQSWRQLPRDEFAIALIVFGAIVLTDLITGVTIGLLLAVGLFVLNYSRISPSRYALLGSEYRSNYIRPTSQEQFLSEQSNQIYIVKLQGFIFFGTANTLLTQVSEMIRTSQSRVPIRFIILDFSLVRGIDFSSTLSFKKLRILAKKQKFKLLFTGLSPKLMKALDQSSILEVTDLTIEVFEDIDRGFEWCENFLLEQAQWRRQRFLPLSMRLSELFDSEEADVQFMGYLQKLTFQEGEIIAPEGEPETGVYIIEEGQVSSITTLSDKFDKRLQTYTPGTVCGFRGLYCTTDHSSTLIADRMSQLYFLSKEAFRQLEQDSPHMANVLLKFILQSQSLQIASYEKELKSLLR